MTFPGHPDAVDDAPIPVTKVVDLDNWTITVDLTKTRILRRLATAFADNNPAWADFTALVEQRGKGPRATVAAHNLRNDRKNWQITDALTLTLAPDTAGNLAEHLATASLLPNRCTADDDHTEDGRCPYWADDTLCAEHHAQADDDATVNVEEAS